MVKVNDTFKNLIPPLSADEYTALETSIVKEGVREAIILWGDFIVDGHNRYEIATRHGLSFKTTVREFASEDDVIIWMIDNQLARRNLSEFVKFELTATQKEAWERIGLKNKSIGGGDNTDYGRAVLSTIDKTALVPTLTATDDQAQIEAQSSPIVKPTIAIPEPQPKKVIAPHNTRNEIAKTLGWSTGKVAMADVVAKKADDQTKEKLRSGDLTINAAYKEVKAAEKKAERIEVIQKQITAIEAGELPELKGLYDVIAIDPPWPYEGENKSVTSYDAIGRRVANPYPEMSIEQIKKIELPLTDNAVVFLWTTHKFLPDAFEILKEWGMEYKATLVWDKQKIGMGAWLRMQCEFCVIGIKGKPYWDNTTYRDVLSEARREHSRKPDGFFDMVDAITMGRKLEYFSREKRNGWEVFGNDTGKFDKWS